MTGSDGLITQTEAAEILGVTRRHLYNIVRQGRLFPVDTGSRTSEMLFRVEEVYAMLELKTRRLDLADTTNLAVQAHALSRSTKRQLEKLCQLMGLETHKLDHHEDAMYSLYSRAVHAAAEPLENASGATISEWAASLNAIDESYLRLLEAYTLDQNPWAPFLALANSLMLLMPESVAGDLDLKFAYTCLDYARKHLRHVAYFYVHTKLGESVAKDTFGINVDDEVIAQMFPQNLS